MKNITKPKNILIIRSAANILNATIKSLKSEFPDSKITIMGPESSQKNIENHPDVDATISAGSINRMSMFSVKKKIIRKVRCCQFDLAIALYNIDHGMGYSNIDFLAWISGAKNIRGYNARGTYIELNGWGILKKYFLEKTSFTWFIINLITTISLFTFITLGLISEWTIRKIITIISPKKVSSSGQEEVALPQRTKSSSMHGLTSEIHQKV